MKRPRRSLVKNPPSAKKRFSPRSALSGSGHITESSRS
jgi:hypothetical protein